MTLLLGCGTIPNDLAIKSTDIPELGTIYLGVYKISINDFLEEIAEIFIKSDLTKNDPRCSFVEFIKGLKIYTSRRFQTDKPIISFR